MFLSQTLNVSFLSLSSGLVFLEILSENISQFPSPVLSFRPQEPLNWGSSHLPWKLQKSPYSTFLLTDTHWYLIWNYVWFLTPEHAPSVNSALLPQKDTRPEYCLETSYVHQLFLLWERSLGLRRQSKEDGHTPAGPRLWAELCSSTSIFKWYKMPGSLETSVLHPR
jgi:hypothetical protein